MNDTGYHVLTDVPDRELKAELERREKVRRKQEKPRPLGLYAAAPVIRVCREYIDHLEEHGWGGENHRRHIFEATLEMVYGKDVWTWINQRFK